MERKYCISHHAIRTEFTEDGKILSEKIEIEKSEYDKLVKISECLNKFVKPFKSILTEQQIYKMITENEDVEAKLYYPFACETNVTVIVTYKINPDEYENAKQH